VLWGGGLRAGLVRLTVLEGIFGDRLYGCTGCAGFWYKALKLPGYIDRSSGRHLGSGRHMGLKRGGAGVIWTNSVANRIFLGALEFAVCHWSGNRALELT